MSNSCAVCLQPATQSCSACSKVYYCSKAHQKRDWRDHKNDCADFKVVVNEHLGRHLVAVRKISQGGVILRKKPLLIGPKVLTAPLCLGCHVKLDFANPVHPCRKCKWPLCSENCENSPHHRDECEIFSKNDYVPFIRHEPSKQSAYASVLPLRALIMKEKNKRKFDLVTAHQSHVEEHRKSQVYQIYCRTLVPLLTVTLKMRSSEEEILTLCSIFDTNSFDVRNSDSTSTLNVRALYPVVSLMAHDCRQNTKHVFSGEQNELVLVLVAATPINEGELITTTYTQTLWNTLARRAHLRQSKHFNCVCDRCKDVTELGTYAGSILCSKCNDKTSKVVSVDPLDDDSVWVCENGKKCSHQVEGSDLLELNERIKGEIWSLEKTPENLERFLVKYQKLLHPTNSHMLQVKYALFQIYGEGKGYTFNDLSDELLGRKVQLCKELLEVADVLQPGYSKFRGCILFGLGKAVKIQSERDLKNGKITDNQFEEIREKIKGYHDEARRILGAELDHRQCL